MLKSFGDSLWLQQCVNRSKTERIAKNNCYGTKNDQPTHTSQKPINHRVGKETDQPRKPQTTQPKQASPVIDVASPTITMMVATISHSLCIPLMAA